jgi:hypothetical protein
LEREKERDEKKQKKEQRRVYCVKNKATNPIFLNFRSLNPARRALTNHCKVCSVRKNVISVKLLHTAKMATEMK